MKKFVKIISLILAIVSVPFISSACSNNSESGTVYITETGSVYHKSSGAHNYKTKSISLEEAKQQSYTACKKCY